MARKTKGIESRFVDLTELDSPQPMTFWGRPGTGKTTLSATAPKPIFYIDVKDRGTESAKTKDLKKGDVVVFTIEDFDDIMGAYDYLSENSGDFKTVVIDHMGALQELAYSQVMVKNNKSRMSQQLYGFASDLMKEVIDLYKSLGDEGILPIFLAQDRTRGGDDGDGEQLDPEVGPALQPAVAKYLMAASRVVGQTYIAEEVDKTTTPGKVKSSIQYRLRLGPHPYYQTKVTKPIDADMPDYLVNPNISQVLDIIKGEYSKPATKRRRRKK